MPKKILWMDNDAVMYFGQFMEVLADEGYEVEVATTLSRADYLIKSRRYDLLILDVMIPTMSAEEEERYRPEQTESGYKAGLVFYRSNRDLLHANSTHVLVLTVRLDSAIRDEFITAGLPPDCFATKYEMKDAGRLLGMIRNLI